VLFVGRLGCLTATVFHLRVVTLPENRIEWWKFRFMRSFRSCGSAATTTITATGALP
jgi:hypothetical protein